MFCCCLGLRACLWVLTDAGVFLDNLGFLVVFRICIAGYVCF